MGGFVCVYGFTTIKGKARLLTVIALVGFLLFDMRFFCFVCNKRFFKSGLQICCTLQSFGYTFVLLFLGKCYYLLCRYEKNNAWLYLSCLGFRVSSALVAAGFDLFRETPQEERGWGGYSTESSKQMIVSRPRKVCPLLCVFVFPFTMCAFYNWIIMRFPTARFSSVFCSCVIHDPNNEWKLVVSSRVSPKTDKFSSDLIC